MEIFKIPFKVTVKNDKFNKQIYTKLVSKQIRLNLENYISYENNQVLDGVLDFMLINRNTSVDYKINDNSLNFLSLDKKIHLWVILILNLSIFMRNLIIQD